MRVRRHVHRHAGERRREVGAVIEVEAAQVVLIRLALPAVLTDHDAWHRFEHLSGPHHRARVELPRRDRALARRLRDADEILGRPFRVGEIGEGRLPGDRHVGAQRQVHRDVEANVASARDRDVAPREREIDQRKDDLRVAVRNGVEAVGALRVADREPRDAAGRAQLD